MYVKEIQEVTLSIKDEWPVIRQFEDDLEWTRIARSQYTHTYRKTIRDCIIDTNKKEKK